MPGPSPAFRRAFYSSPYDAHPEGTDAAFRAACAGVLAFAPVPLLPVFRWHGLGPGIWSPVIEGHVASGIEARDRGTGWTRDFAMRWCRSRIDSGVFDALICGDLVPGYDASAGCRDELGWARAAGLTVIRESEVSR